MGVWTIGEADGDPVYRDGNDLDLAQFTGFEVKQHPTNHVFGTGYEGGVNEVAQAFKEDTLFPGGGGDDAEGSPVVGAVTEDDVAVVVGEEVDSDVDELALGFFGPTVEGEDSQVGMGVPERA